MFQLSSFKSGLYLSVASIVTGDPHRGKHCNPLIRGMTIFHIFSLVLHY